MKFAVGYKLPAKGADTTVDIVRDFKEHIAEVYFPWVAASSGRAALGVKRGAADWTAQQTLERDLHALRDMGVRLDLLFNANCYGGRAISEHLQSEVGSLLDYLESRQLAPNVVTTTSLTVARTVKRYFPAIEVRASVNMRIESPEAMSYVSGLFDSFYARRDMQRNPDYVRSLKDWCDANKKGLYLLANSGCLYQCPGQTFHDNMVAHDAEIDEAKNIPDWTPHVCWNIYRKEENRSAILRAAWIRPEDVRNYEGLTAMMKLATRLHDRPRIVVKAYVEGKYDGNLLDLFEPGHGPAFAPHIIDNALFPPDWFATTSTCNRACHKCEYCTTVFNRVYKLTDED
ncbi:MAG: hypothetical protein HZA50_06780 [Planctomycetes bacterium]|nr:hypothetical protein [Planctomycetota bacterium]